MRPLTPIALTFAALAGAIHGGDRITGKPFATRSEVLAKNGMAATSQPLATAAALEILRQGGSAVDAAIAANAVQCLTEPVGCGVGGDLFAMVWDSKGKRLHGLNASGRSPRALTLDEFKRRGLSKIPSIGPLPVSVPGCVDGWFELHARFGKLPMKDVLAPAIRYARDGYPVAELVAHYWAISVPRLSKYPGFVEQFTIDGAAPKKGQLFSNPNLAATFEALASKGRDEFYKGSIAREIDAYMKANGGFLAYDDLAAHRSEWVEPIAIDYRGYRVYELPPNGQGIAALEMLNVLEGYDLAKMGFGSAEHLHVLTEAKKLAFEDRARFIADPAFAKLPVAGLLSDDYAAQQRARIDLGKAAASYAPGAPQAFNPALDEGDTIYLCTADRDGNMVSLIQSNYRGMGSGMAPGKLGFILQDRGEMFDLDPTSANAYAPSKRPFHTIIPAFVTKDGEPFLCFGVMGGATQPQGHVQILLNVIDFGMNFQEAGDAPRMVHTGSSEPTGERMTDGGKLCLESGFDPAVARELERRGHVLGKAVGDYGGYQAIGFDPKTRVYYGASESRKDGMAAGY
ncbi:MAG: gamma-glutamyltransferase [Planctomycetota bacterium]|nr:MAG: gamma-glutamyltransferase [Planctomycetota bacterium]